MTLCSKVVPSFRWSGNRLDDSGGLLSGQFEVRIQSREGHQVITYAANRRTLPAVKFLVERRLKANGVRLKSLRQELTELSEQQNQLTDEADDHRIRAIMSESPFDALEAKESGRHADAFTRRRAEIVASIAKLEAQQDQLLDQLSGGQS